MQVPIGEMREPVVIMTPVLTIDESGGEYFTYTETGPLFVSIRAISTNEAIQFSQVNAEISHVCFGHWHDLNALSATNRVRMVETLQEFDIAGGPINDPKRAYSRLNLVYRENA